ncbi:MAG: hypothetical protein KDD64_17300, partial [Bdellovibrionales bacterium]|nr:hypothetical protein [Bdellovibrionales bacterium]
MSSKYVASDWLMHPSQSYQTRAHGPLSSAHHSPLALLRGRPKPNHQPSEPPQKLSLERDLRPSFGAAVRALLADGLTLRQISGLTYESVTEPFGVAHIGKKDFVLSGDSRRALETLFEHSRAFRENIPPWCANRGSNIFLAKSDDTLPPALLQKLADAASPKYPDQARQPNAKILLRE